MKKTLLIAVLFLTTTFAASAQNSSQSYIEKFKDNAIRIMHESGVPASIILAVAMHESANGNSAVARNLNNHFGMKGHSQVSPGHKRIHSSYKQYDSAMDSFQDFARIMTERKQFSHLAATLSHYDYKNWVKGIQRSGYASSHLWGSQVLGLIHKYQLYSYDESPDSAKVSQHSR